MTRKLKGLIVFVLIIVLVLITGAGESIARGVTFYARVVKLYTQTPESRISMPLTQISRNQIANTWHAARGADRLHEGQDIFAPKGTPILSATRGLVYKIGENSLGGQTVSVIGAGGRVYYYAHLDAYAPNLAEGDFVTPQTVLGFVGTTGNAQGTPPHLHFGIYTSSGPIDPLPLLADRVSPPRQQPVERNSEAGRTPAHGERAR
ncbi:MAG TPA: M23 family metallopeptidase [Pyrinomonadaceae bacterium]|nr:M23 family metallopeptidase [Pyrinomonadaceae bacterium]